MTSILCIALCTTILSIGVRPSLIVAQEPTPVIAPAVAPAPFTEAPPQWEYSVLTEDALLKELGDTKQDLPSYEAKTSAALSAQGSKGWELVSVITQPYYNNGSKIVSTVRYVFKRTRYLEAATENLDTEQAARLAATLANASAKKNYGVTPFNSANAVPQRVDDRWHWQATVQYDQSSMVAVVDFSSSGTNPTLNLAVLPRP